MPWATGDALTSTNLNTKVPTWNGTIGAVRYVKTVANGGSDANDGLTWATAKATPDSAVASLPTSGSGNSLVHRGTVFVAGRVDTAGDLELNSCIRYQGVSESNSFAAASEVSGIRLASGSNKWMFKVTNGWRTVNEFLHNVSINDLDLDGNESGQTHAATVSGVNITFTDGNPATIVRASGDFGTDGWLAGDFVEVRNSTSNDGMYEIQSVSGATLNLSNDTVASEVRHELIAEGPVAGVTLFPCRYGLVRAWNGGFNNIYRNCHFRNSRIGLLHERSLFTVKLRDCNFSSISGRGVLLRTWGSGQFHWEGGEVDNCGKSAIEIHRNDSAGGALFHFVNLKFECALGDTGAQHFRIFNIRPRESGGGNQQMPVVLQGMKAFGPSVTVTNSSLVWERGGAGFPTTIVLDYPAVTRYDHLIVSAKTSKTIIAEVVGLTNAHSVGRVWLSYAQGSQKAWPGLVLGPVPTADLPAANANRDGEIWIEDDVSNGQNLVFYAGALRKRIAGTSF